MEFDHVGHHCAVSTCKQRDFLPFTCQVCKGVYCLDHRTFSSHGCHGEALKDIMSMECPICQESIKYNRSQDVDMVWDDHFTNICKQSNEYKPAKKRCAEKSCRAILSISNTYKCQKCQAEVCLSHRNTEDHHCSRISGALMTNNASAPMVVPPSSSNPYRVPLKNEAFLSKIEVSSSSRKLGTSTVASRGRVETCPSCQLKFPDMSSLISHCDRMHSPTTSKVDTSADIAMEGTNTCPNCQASFVDVVQLVDHFEAAHGETQQSAPTSAPKDNTTCVVG